MYSKLFFLLLVVLTIACQEDSTPIPESRVTWQLNISSQEELDNFDFSSIDTIKGEFSIRNTTVRDLSFLTEICITGRVDILYNDSLRTLDGIENLSCIKTLIIRKNVNLRDIRALSNIVVSENLTIRQNELEKAEPIIGLSSLSGEVFIGEDKLQDYSLLSNLTSVNSLILGGTQASNLDHLSSLEKIESSLIIQANRNLVDYCGLKAALLNSGEIKFETLQTNRYNPASIEEIIMVCQ